MMTMENDKAPQWRVRIETTVARKSMAERYASQRGSTASRRRALPRTGTLAAAARDYSGDDRYDDSHLGRAPKTSGGVAMAQAPMAAPVRPRQTAIPRRAGVGAPGRLRVEPITVDYGYVRRDLRRTAIVAVGLFVLLIVLNLVLQAIIH